MLIGLSFAAVLIAAAPLNESPIWEIAEGETRVVTEPIIGDITKTGRGTLETRFDREGRVAVQLGTWRIAGESKVVCDGSHVNETSWFYIKGLNGAANQPADAARVEVTDGSSLTIKGVNYLGLGDRNNANHGYGVLSVTDGSFLDVQVREQTRITDYGTNGGVGILAITNSAANFTKIIRISPTDKPANVAQLHVNHSVMTNGTIYAGGSSATNGAWFDGATLIPNAKNEKFFDATANADGSYFRILPGGLTIDAVYDVTVTSNATLSGAGGLVKKGAKTLTLLGNQSYTGLTRVEKGILVVQGTLAGPFEVGEGAQLEYIDANGARQVVEGGGIPPRYPFEVTVDKLNRCYYISADSFKESVRELSFKYPNPDAESAIEYAVEKPTDTIFRKRFPAGEGPWTVEVTLVDTDGRSYTGNIVVEKLANPKRAPASNDEVLVGLCGYDDALDLTKDIMEQDLCNLYVGWHSASKTHPDNWPAATRADWAQKIKDRKMWSMSIYSGDDAALQAKLTDAYEGRYLGNNVGEYASYLYQGDSARPSSVTNNQDLLAARDTFVNRYIHAAPTGWQGRFPYIFSTCGAALSCYELAGGIDFICNEQWAIGAQNIAHTSAEARGAARKWKPEYWCAWNAHEWQTCGIPYHTDQKFDSCLVGYLQEYVFGTSVIVLESGTQGTQAWEYTAGYPGQPKEARAKEGYDGEVARRYREVTKRFYDWVKANPRDAGAPETKIAMALGNLDSFLGMNSGFTVWAQHANAATNNLWKYGAPEQTQNLLKEIFFPINPNAVEPYTNTWLGGTPYGQADVVNVDNETTIADLRRYDLLVFGGWNTMMPLEKDVLERYVKEGGTLVMSRPELTTRIDRDYVGYTDADLLPLFDFLPSEGAAGEYVEKEVGKGRYFLFTHHDFPSATAAGRAAYESLVRSLAGEVSQSVTIDGDDMALLSITYGVYPKKIYFLNTDTRASHTFVWKANNQAPQEMTLAPCEIKVVNRTADPLGPTGGITDRVSFTDGKATWTNPGCGYAGGGWSTLEKDGSTSVKLKLPNQTKLWSLQKFSKGYYYNNDPKHYEKAMYYCGGADIPLTPAALESISNAFESCRAAGGTVIPRFAYTWDGWGGCEPDDFGMVLTHIRQLAALCSLYRDVIPAIECGIIGAYGEMHTSRYTDRDHARQITSAWLDNLPADMALLVRSPCYIIYEAGVANTSEFFLSGATDWPRIRRMGFYNDGYLGTDGDYGTWGSGNLNFVRDQGRAYLRPRGDIPYGGEFATVTEEYFDQNVHLLDPARFNLVAEWYDTHLSYLRTIHATDMTIYRRLAETAFSSSIWAFDNMPYLAEYDGESMQKFCEDHMGYRYVVRGVEARRDGRAVALQLAIENTGFGKLCFPETKEVLLTGEGGHSLVVPATGTDLRLLEGGRMTTVEVRFALPALSPLGTYALSLRERVPLADENGSGLPRRAIAFANEGAYDATTKANYLCTLSIDGSVDYADAVDVSAGGEVFTVVGTTNDLRKTVFLSGSQLVLSGGGTVFLGASVPEAIEIRNGRLEFASFPADFDFAALVTHGNEVVIRNDDAAPRFIGFTDRTYDDCRLVGNFRYRVPAGETITLNAPAWIADFGIDIYGTLDVRADLTLAGRVDAVIHAGGTMGNLGREATNQKGKIIVRDRARIVVEKDGALLNPVNGNWSGSGLELMTEIEGVTSLVLDGGTVAIHRMSGTGRGRIEVTADSTWDVWYGEWYGNGRKPDPFKGASSVHIADGATLMMERIRQTFGTNQQDGGDVTVRLADVHVTGAGNLVFSNAHPTKKVEFVISSQNECTGEVSLVEDVGASLVFLSGSSWAGGVVITPGVTLPENWWFSYNAARGTSQGGHWLSADLFEAERASDSRHDAIISFSGVAGWLVELPEVSSAASFLFLEENGSLVPYGHAAEGWVRLGGRDFTEGVTFELEIDFRYCKGAWTVGFTVDGTVLADEHGRTRFPTVYDPTALRRIAFDGPGRRGDFKGRLVRRPQGFVLEIH